VLLRLAYPTVTNAFAVLLLLSMTDRGKDAEILALCRQITVMERQLGGERLRFSPSDRAFPAALPHRFPSQVLRRIRLVVRPDRVLRRHRDLIARRHAVRSRPKCPGRPRTVRLVRPRRYHEHWQESCGCAAAEDQPGARRRWRQPGHPARPALGRQPHERSPAAGSSGGIAEARSGRP